MTMKVEKERGCVINFEEGKFRVSYRGEWTRRDVENAYYALVKELPKFLVERRKILEGKESDDGRRKGRRRKESGGEITGETPREEGTVEGGGGNSVEGAVLGPA